MTKLPAIQWYVGDWRKDSCVQALDYEARGVWFEMLMIMHELPAPGLWSLNGTDPMPDETAARLLGVGVAKAKQIFKRLIANGVAKRQQNTGILYNARMLRDNDLRKRRAEFGSKGGKQTASKRQANALAKGSSSVAVSVSSSELQLPPPSLSKDQETVSPPDGTAAQSNGGGGGLEPVGSNGKDFDHKKYYALPPDGSPELAFVMRWNTCVAKANRHGMKIERWSPEMTVLYQARMKRGPCAHPEQGPELLFLVIDRMSRTPFLIGNGPVSPKHGRAFQASPRWFLSDDNLEKIADGHYDQERGQ